MISIALCTYNGEAYVGEQLKSLTMQTFQPDEIIICDDCSKDSTVAIINNIMTDWKGSWQLFVNPQNLGYRKNFQKAISLCKGDIIFLSDQDDVWDKNKLKIMTPFLQNDPQVMLAIHDVELVNRKLECIRPSFWGELSYNPKCFNDGDYTCQLRESIIQGAASVFRRELFTKSCPFPAEANHDEWLGMNAVFLGKVVAINKKLMKYRQTGHNQIGGHEKLSWLEKTAKWGKQFQKELKVYQNYLYHQEVIWKELSRKYPEGEISGINSQIFYAFLQKRVECIKNGKWFSLPSLKIYEEMLKNPAEGKKQWVKDRMLILR